MTLVDWRRSAGTLCCALFMVACASGCHRAPSVGADGGSLVDGQPPVAGNATPLALLISQKSDRSLTSMLVYDRDGNRLYDLTEALKLDAQHQVNRITAGLTRVISVGPRDAVYFQDRYVDGWHPGLAWHPAETQVVVRAAVQGGSSCQLIGLTARGKRTFELAAEGKWDYFHLSPRGRYLFGSDNHGAGIVIDTRTAATTWSGTLRSGMFATDDSAFIYTRPLGERLQEVVLRALPDGAETPLPLPAALADTSFIKADGHLIIRLAATSSHGLLFAIGQLESLLTLERLFLHVYTPDGKWIAAGQGSGTQIVETLYGFAGQGKVAVFSREVGADPAPAKAGVFGFDLEVHEVKEYSSTALQHGASHVDGTEPTDVMISLAVPHANGRFFDWNRADIHRPILETWSVDAPAKVQVGAFEQSDMCWHWGIPSLTEAGDRLHVGLFWMCQSIPSPTAPIPQQGTRVLDVQGKTIAVLPAGQGTLDRAGRLLVMLEGLPLFGPAWAPADARCAVANLDTGKVTWLDRTGGEFAVVYDVQ